MFLAEFLFLRFQKLYFKNSILIWNNLAYIIEICNTMEGKYFRPILIKFDRFLFLCIVRTTVSFLAAKSSGFGGLSVLSKTLPFASCFNISKTMIDIEEKLR